MANDRHEKKTLLLYGGRCPGQEDFVSREDFNGDNRIDTNFVNSLILLNSL